MATFFVLFYLLYSHFVSIFVNMGNQIYIPKKLKVGYQKRMDTYSKKLAYVVYYDEKGKLRKETSWKGWIDKKQGIDEFENVPTEGFVLNRNVGGVKNSYSSWSSEVRIEKVRVFDPRGFEFEIDIPNVLTILQECTSAKGKGLEGTFVYGWSGSNLVLLPTTSHEYQESVAYTALQSGKVESKSLIIGASYKTKKGKDLIYLGKFDWVERNYRKGGWFSEKKHIFVDENAHLDYAEDIDMSDFEDENEYQEHLEDLAKESALALKRGENFRFIPLASTATLALCNSETPVSHYAELLERFNSTHNAAMPTAFIEKPITPKLEVKKSYGWWEMKSDAQLFIKDETKPGVYFSISLSPDSRYDKKQPTVFELTKNRKIYFDAKGNFRSDYADHEYPRPKYKKAELEKMSFVSLSMKLNNSKTAKIKDYL